MAFIQIVVIEVSRLRKFTKKNVFQAVAFALGTLLLAQPSYAIEKCGSAKRVTCVVDGDTLWLKGEKIRLMGYDTPEPATNLCGGKREKELAGRATERLITLLTSNEFTLERHGEDRYKRTLAVLRIGTVNVGDILVSEGLARTWPDGPEFWCD